MDAGPVLHQEAVTLPLKMAPFSGQFGVSQSVAPSIFRLFSIIYLRCCEGGGSAAEICMQNHGPPSCTVVTHHTHGWCNWIPWVPVLQPPNDITYLVSMRDGVSAAFSIWTQAPFSSLFTFSHMSGAEAASVEMAAPPPAVVSLYCCCAAGGHRRTQAIEKCCIFPGNQSRKAPE